MKHQLESSVHTLSFRVGTMRVLAKGTVFVAEKNLAGNEYDNETTGEITTIEVARDGIGELLTAELWLEDIEELSKILPVVVKELKKIGVKL